VKNKLHASIQARVDEVEPILERMQNRIESLPPGAAHDQMLANFLRFRCGVDGLPTKIAALGPFETADHLRAVLAREIDAAWALYKRGN
jgi:hypothetical protein